MIQYKEFTLNNGLQVIVHEDFSVPLVALNIMYDVGSRDENPNKTGFAHLFEHLMFGGSKNIENFDTPIQRVGGDNNAFTSPDITNYYMILPKENIETAFWLESDRMMSLSFSQKSLDIQKKVVIEEFKQRYLNQPYGDVWLKLRPLAYTTHPYQWATIGKDISHIEDASLNDVKEFFFKHYRPCNAKLVITGNITVKEAERLSKKWFEPIEEGTKLVRNLPKEPIQTEAKKLDVYSDVPLEALYMSFHMCGKTDDLYTTTDLLSDILGRGKSSRLFQTLVKEKKIFNSVSSYIAGSFDPGQFIIAGKPNTGVSLEEAEAALWDCINEIKSNSITEDELEKVKNQAETSVIFSEIELLNKTINLAYATILGNPNSINMESEQIQKVNLNGLSNVAETIFRPENSSTLFYRTTK